MDIPVAMVSSTAVDLPEHRAKVKDACLEADWFPKMMEHLPASAQDAITTSMAMVDVADALVAIFACRYGYVPKGHDRSITEMEVDRAIARPIEILPFVMHDDHPVTAAMVERSRTAARKLERLKKRVCEGRHRRLFKSADELAAQVQRALGTLATRRAAQAAADQHQTTVLSRLVEQDWFAEMQDMRRRLRELEQRIEASRLAPAAADPAPA